MNQLHQYTYTRQFTPGSDNVVADILSNSNSTPAPHGANDQGEEDIIQIHTTPGHSVTARVRQTSEQVPALSQFCNFIQEGWLSKVPEELAVFSQVKQELSFWNVTCMACGMCMAFTQWSLVPCLHVYWLWCMRVTCVIVKLKQHCSKPSLVVRDRQEH